MLTHFSHQSNFQKNKEYIMASYTVISKNIKDYRLGINRNTDIFLCSFLKAIRTYKTGKCHARQVRINELTGIKIRTIQSCISRLRTTPHLTVETAREGKKKMNIYSFEQNPKHWFQVKNEIFYTEKGVKEIGFLLLIKSLCLNDTNTTFYSCNKISEELGQSRKTVSKLIDSLIEKNMLLALKSGYQVSANYFPPIFKNDYEKFVYDSIISLCQERDSILFSHNFEALKVIAAKYPFKQKDFEKLDKEDLKRYYLPQILQDRCPTLPDKIESLGYFSNVLNIESVKSDKDTTLIL